MESKSYALWTGIFTLSLIAAFVLITGWMGARSKQHTVRYLMVSLQSVSGLNRQAPVLYRGIEVGRVGDLRIDPVHRQQVLISIDIAPDVKPTVTTYAKLRPQGITGLNSVELFDDATGRPLDPATESIPMRPSDLSEMGDSLLETMQSVRQAANHVNALLNDSNRARFTELLTRLDNAAKAIEPAVTQVGLTMAEAKTTLTQGTITLQKVGQLVDRADGSLASLSGKVGDAADQLNHTAARVDTLTLKLDGMTDNVDATLLPQLEQLLNQANRAAYSLDTLLRQQARQSNSLLFGGKAHAPGPGEAGYAAPAAAK